MSLIGKSLFILIENKVLNYLNTTCDDTAY